MRRELTRFKSAIESIKQLLDEKVDPERLNNWKGFTDIKEMD